MNTRARITATCFGACTLIGLGATGLIGKGDHGDRGNRGGRGNDEVNSGHGGGLPSHAELKAILKAVVEAAQADPSDANPDWNGGLSNDMWATVVNRDGEVCAVAFTGENRGEQWPGSRVISAQKANTANAFSLPAAASGPFAGLALSTANLYAAVQPGGSLFGLQESNPVDTSVAYRGSARNYGQHNDPMVGFKIGGVNVFGGGFPLYNSDGDVIGAIGVSGDTSCTDHIVAWKVRDALELDNVPAGVGGPDADNIIFPIGGAAPVGFEHPECGFGETPIAQALPTTHPIGPNP